MISKFVIEPNEQREQNNARIDFAESRMRKDAVQSAYAFFHQKQRIYQYSTLDWQKDDIEYAIENYADSMSPELYELISEGRTDFLRNHTTFPDDIVKALDKLEGMLDK